MENEFDWNRTIPKEQQLYLTEFQDKKVSKDLLDKQAVKNCRHTHVIYDFKSDFDSTPELICVDCGVIIGPQEISH